MIRNLPEGWASVHAENPRYIGTRDGRIYGLEVVALDDTGNEIYREYVGFASPDYPTMSDMSRLLSDLTENRRKFRTR